MASSSSSNGTLVDDFEESFQACIHALTKHDAGGTGTDKDEINLDVAQTTNKFVDLARQMESFFIQKRFLLSAMKPELVLKEENFDLRYEMTRKDDLIKRHYEKIDHWKAILSDLQQQNGVGGGVAGAAGGISGGGGTPSGIGGGGAGGIAGGAGGSGVGHPGQVPMGVNGSGGGPPGIGGGGGMLIGPGGHGGGVGSMGAQMMGGGNNPHMGGGGMHGGGGHGGMGGGMGGVGGPMGGGGGGMGHNPMAMAGVNGGGMPNAMPNQMHQQQHHLQQQQMLQQQMHMQQQQQQQQQMQGQMYNMPPGGAVGGGGAMNARVGGGVPGGGVPNVFGPGGQAQNALQGPLAYLEKTTSNIDLVGMGDGRR